MVEKTIEEQSLLRDLPNEKDIPIAHMFRVSNMQLKEAKSGKSQYLMFTLADRSKEIPWCKKWKCTEDDYEKYKDCKVLFITGKTDMFNGQLSIECDSLAIPEDDVAVEFLEQSIPKSPYDVKFLKGEIWQFIKKIKNKHIKKLCLHTLNDEEVKEKLTDCVAAKGNHHNYKHGLLTHIVRLLYITEGVCDSFNNFMFPGGKYIINKDLLIAGCILHDLYKLREYEGMDYSLEGNLLPHLPLIAIQINRFMDQIDLISKEEHGDDYEPFPEEIRKQLSHILLSHHFEINWGSPVTPCTIEAVVLHFCDQLSAKVDPMLEQLDALPEGTIWTEKVKCIGKKAYMGGMLISD